MVFAIFALFVFQKQTARVPKSMRRKAGLASPNDSPCDGFAMVCAIFAIFAIFAPWRFNPEMPLRWNSSFIIHH